MFSWLSRFLSPSPRPAVDEPSRNTLPPYAPPDAAIPSAPPPAWPSPSASRETRTLSEQGSRLLHEREGKRNRAYRDSKGYWTIGYGHLLSKETTDDYSNVVWTDEKVWDTWLQDKWVYEKAVNDCVTVPLEQHQFDALVSFAFNCGVNALPHGGNPGPSSILRALNAGDYHGAGMAFNNWMADPEVRTRRAGERDQFLGIAFEARRPV